MTAGAICVPTIVPLRVPVLGQHKSAIDTNTKVELHSDTPNVTIYYTVNGQKPEPFQIHSPAAKSTFKYREPFRLPGGKISVKAIAIAEDGIRESHCVTKAFDVEQLEQERPRMADDGLDFVNDIPAQEVARKEVKKFQHNMVSSKDAWAEVQKMKDKEDMMREMSLVGSSKRKPQTGPRHLNNRMASSDRVTIGGQTALGTVNGLDTYNGMTESEMWKSKRTPPDTATQALRLQRETDFLKCIYCFAPRPADPYARFCNECGNPVPALPQGRMPPPEAGQMGTCVECKSLVPFNTANCLICGADIPSQNIPQASLRLADKQLCVECGTANPANLSTCITCEARLPGNIKPLFHGSAAPALPKGEGRMLTCTKCGRVNSCDARFCDWCGSKPTAAVCNLVCSKCNANNNPYSGFCGSCGVRLEPPQRPDVRNSGLAVSINPSTLDRNSQAQWLPLSLPVNPVPKCDMATQTVGLFYPSQREINKKQVDEEEKLALEKQMRDRKPLMTSISPGRGYWRKQMDHICAHLRAHAQNNAEFRALIGEPRMGKIESASVHEDGYELSLTVNLSLRGTKDPFMGKKMYNSDYLSSYTRKASIGSYASQDSLASGMSTTRSTGRKTSARGKRSARRVKKKTVRNDAEEKLSSEDKQLLREVGKSGDGRPSDIQQLVEEGADANCLNKDGLPVLHVAVQNKHVDAIPVLIQEGADINQRGPVRGNTALHEAVNLGSSGLEVMDTLLGCGANPQRKNDKGETPYDLAIKAGYESIANKLTASVGQSALDKLIKPRNTVMADEF